MILSHKFSLLPNMETKEEIYSTIKTNRQFHDIKQKSQRKLINSCLLIMFPMYLLLTGGSCAL